MANWNIKDYEINDCGFLYKKEETLVVQYHWENIKTVLFQSYKTVPVDSSLGFIVAVFKIKPKP